MQPDPNIPSSKDNRQAGSFPPLLPASEPPMIGAAPTLPATSPPPLPQDPNRKCLPVGKMFAFLLSLCLGFFLADAVVCLVDDSLILLFDLHVLTVIRGILFVFAMLMAIVIYGLMGLTPKIPKRLFLPLTLFNPVAGLVVVPCLIYFYGRIQQVAWSISFAQVILALTILRWVQGGFEFRWPLVAENQLGVRRFSWWNLSVFLLVNLFVLLPAVIVYLVLCGALAIDHFSDGFLTLRPEGLTVQVRKYVRNDGKTIQLLPMSHIGDPDFYRKLSQSFPTNSIILMEGVSDKKHLLTNTITYKRMATTLGVAEQQKEFKPRGELVRADLDVEQFAGTTIDFLNLVTLIHSKGVNAETVLKLVQFSPSDFEEQLFDDLLRKRNRRLMEEIHDRLSQSEHIIVPWGAAHMPEIAKAIQKSGFGMVETQEYVAIRFRSAGNTSKSAGKGGDSAKPK